MNPQMPQMPGVGAVTDSLDFVKNLWGSMSVPGMSIPGLGAPALSLDDLDKKIADLKAVEAWLNVNVAMLRGTVQALEVQRGTIATLKSMGASMAEAMKQPGADQKSVMASTPFASAFFGQAAAAPAAAAAAAAPPEAAKASEAAAASPFMPDPAMWWNVLQEQFKQAVSSTMSPEAMEKANAMAQEAATRMGAAVAPKPAASDDKAAEDAPPNGANGKARATKGKPGKS
ncbi:MAG: PhaM family polyhydroxyalkanoate granule multifunctional regulatory protein [Pseudomonadota bacterium]